GVECAGSDNVYTCDAVCYSDDECTSNCCVGLTNNTSVCMAAVNCCDAQIGQYCTKKADCCPDSNGNPATCVNFSQGQSCAAVCSAGGRCPSDCCAALQDGTGACHANDGTVNCL